MLLTIVAFFVVLAILIIAHEFGHFITAKAFKVKVEEFGLGFPPRITGFRRGETLYSLNATPLGGFVRLSGENDPDVPRSLAGKGIGPRLLILSAGSLMNILMPLLLFTIAFMIPHTEVLSQVTVDKVIADSPAAIAGIKPGDTLLAINGNTIHNLGDIQRDVQINLGEKINITVRHADSTTQDITVVPRWYPPPGEGAIGIQMQMTDPQIISRSYPLWEAVPLATRESIDTLILFKNGIISMIIGATPVALTGPVGIAQITGEYARAGISPLLEFAAFLSINLAIVNIFPLPALDGGRVAFVLLEWLRRGKRVSAKTEGLVHLIGLMVLISFIMIITYQDILRIITGGSLP